MIKEFLWRQKKNLLLTSSVLYLILLFFPHSAEAQETVRIQQLHIQVMPEFDDPRVLVIVQGRLSGNSESFPRPVTFYIPAGAQINQMATMDVSSGQTTPQAYETSPHPIDPRWTAVTYTLDNAHFFYEFYYTPYATGPEKQFTYVFNSPLPVDDLLIEVQEPMAAEEFTLEPAADDSWVDNFGLTRYQLSMSPLNAGEDRQIDITYTKVNPAPSVSREQVMAMEATNEVEETAVAEASPPAAGNITGLSAVDISGIGLFVLGGGVAMAIFGRSLWLHKQSKSQTPALATLGTRRAKFCSQCGAALKSDSQFCHECGEALA